MSSWGRWCLLGSALALAACDAASGVSRVQTTGRARVSTLDPQPQLDGVGVSSGGPAGFRYLVVAGDTAFATTPFGRQVYRRAASGWVSATGYESLPPALFPSAVSGDRVVTVSSDRIFSWVRSGDTWSVGDVVVWEDFENPLSEPAALSGDTLFVRNTGGRVLVFELQGGVTWVQRQTLVGSDSGPSFGRKLAASSEQVLILGGDTVYVFAAKVGGWEETQKFTLEDGSVPSDLVLAADVVLLSSPSGVHEFLRDQGFWSFRATLSETGSVFDALGDLVLLDTRVYQRSANGFRFRRDFREGPLSRFLTGRAPTTVVSGRLFDGGALLGLNSGSYSFDGLTFPAASSLVSVEVYSEPESCATDSDCKSSRCVEGVCCRTECSAGCTSCRADRKSAGPDGECGNVKEGADPLDSCAAQPSKSCGTTGECDGAGACALFSEGTPCDFGYLCVPGACRTTCVDDSECDVAHGYACRANTCQAMNSGGGGSGASSASGGAPDAGAAGEGTSAGGGGARNTESTTSTGGITNTGGTTSTGAAGNSGSAGEAGGEDAGAGAASGGVPAAPGEGGTRAAHSRHDGGCSVRSPAGGAQGMALALFAAALASRRRATRLPGQRRVASGSDPVPAGRAASRIKID